MFLHYDEERRYRTIKALMQYVEEAKTRTSLRSMSYTRGFWAITRRAKEARSPLNGMQVTQLYLCGLLERV